MHLSIYRKVLVSLLAVFAIGAVGAASASAATWHVSGSELGSSEALSSTTKTIRNIKLSFSTFGIECGGAKLTGAKITAPGGGQMEHLVFTGCHVISPKCSLPAEKLETKPLKMEASLGSSPEDTLVLKPASGTEVLTFELAGSSCSLEGEHFLDGKITATLQKGQDELAEQELVFHTTTASGELKGSWPMELYGSLDMKLTSGSLWSFH